MIHEQTLEAVFPLATKLTERKITVSPIAQTPLSALVGAAHLPMPNRGMDAEQLDTHQRILMGSSMANIRNEHTHDMVMDDIVNAAARTVQSNLAQARNVIRPAVNEVTDKVEEYIDHSETIFQSHVNVVPVFFHRIWGNSYLADLIARYKDVRDNEGPLNITVPMPEDTETLIEWAMTGAPVLDSEIQDLISKLQIGALEGYWQDIFGRRSDYRSLRQATAGTNHVNNKAMAMRSLLTHLWSRNLAENVPDNIRATANDFKQYMLDLKAASGYRMNRIMNELEQANRNDRLLTSYPTNQHDIGRKPIEIRVNGRVYQRFLDAGGEPDALIGAMVSDQETQFSKLIEKNDRYAEIWGKRARSLEQTQKLDRKNYAVEGLRLVVSSMIKEQPEEERFISRAAAHERLDKAIACLPSRFDQNLYENIRRVVCHVFYAHTMGLQILETIDAIAKDQPNIPIREVAGLAEKQIVAAWVVKNMHVHVDPA